MGEDQTFQQGIASQAILSVYAVAACLTDGIQMLHGGVAVTVHPDTTHKIVLGGNHRNRLFRTVVALFQTSLVNIREMTDDGIFWNRCHGKVHIGHIIDFHLSVDLFGEQISR